MKVTVSKSGRSKNMTLETLVGQFKGESLRKRVLQVREVLRHCAPYHQPVGMEKVPTVHFSSLYRKGEWHEYTGLVLIEYQRVDSYAEARELCSQIVCYTRPLLAFVGSSGRSVKVVVRYTLPDGSLPLDKEAAACFHAHAYKHAVQHYQAQFQREVSLKEPLLDKGCRMTYDSEVFYNPDSVPVKMEQPGVMPVETHVQETLIQPTDPLATVLPCMQQYEKMKMLFETCLADALREVTAATTTDKDDDDKERLMVAVARRCFDSGIPEEETVRRLTMHLFLDTHPWIVRAAVRNVYGMCKAFGKKPCIPYSTNIVSRTEEFLQRRYEFRKNELREEVEYKERHTFCFRFRPVTPEVLNGICLNAMEEGIEAWDKDIKRYIYSPRIPAYHPVQEFFYALPAWDGKDRIRALADTVPTADGQWRERFYVWFLSMVAHWRKPDAMYANSLVSILTGGQGASKSVFFRRLLPPALQSYLVESINLENKTETELLMAQNLLIVIDEFDRFGRKYQADLKHLIQKPMLKIRIPHQKTFRNMPRLCAFAATANPMDLLTDPTGSRRYICIQLTGAIDVSSPIEYEQLYAQAVAAINAGERYWLNTEEEQELTNENAAFQQAPIEIQYLYQYFRLPEMGEAGKPYSAVELLDMISLRSKRKFSNTTALSFARMLNASGIKKVHTNRGNCYYLTEK